MKEEEEPSQNPWMSLAKRGAEHRSRIGVLLILSTLTAALSLLLPIATQQLVGAIGTQRPWLPWVVFLSGALLLGAIAGGVQQYFAQRFGEQIVATERKKLVQRISRLPIAFFDQHGSGEMISRSVNDTSQLRYVLTYGVSQAASGALMAIGSVIAMTLIDATLLLIAATCVIICVLGVMLFLGAVARASRLLQESIAAISERVGRMVRVVRTIRANNATGAELSLVRTEIDEAYRAGLKVARLSAILSPAGAIATNASMIAVLGLGGSRVASGALPLEDLVAFLMFLFILVSPLTSMLSFATGLGQAVGAVSRIDEILSSQPEADQPDSGRLPDAGENHGNVVEFTDVSFAYRPPQDSEGPSNQEICGLRDVSFGIKSGFTAIVGPSGAGKSTVLALIERFYDVNAGTIRFLGRDTRDLSRRELRQCVAYVDQDSTVLDGSVLDNLRLGAPEANQAECRRVLTRVGFGKRGVPRIDLDMKVGIGGRILSGGERQRLAIARAFLRDPLLLLFDEPTSNLDGLGEREIHELLASMSRHRAVVIVAHRLSTVSEADQIVVMDEGRVDSVGTHDELLSSSFLYKELVAAQSLRSKVP